MVHDELHNSHLFILYYARYMHGICTSDFKLIYLRGVFDP